METTSCGASSATREPPRASRSRSRSLHGRAATGRSARAGLESGDILLEIDGRPVENVNAFRNRIAAMAPGRDVTLRVFRDGKERTIKARIGELPEEDAGEPEEESETAVDLGFTVGEVTAEIGKGQILLLRVRTGRGARYVTIRLDR